MSKVPQIIKIRGARVHNLKNVDLDIPLQKLICFSGPSGSGKTSLAFHTLATESKRRLVNSFPNSMKFFSDRPSAVDVDEIFPVLPVFALPQINPILGARSVVSDVMRLTDSLQALFFNYAVEYCPKHQEILKKASIGTQLQPHYKNLSTEETGYLLLKPLDYQRYHAEDALPQRSWDKEIQPFEKEHAWWEVLRFKLNKPERLEQYWEELNLKTWSDVEWFFWAKGLKKPVSLSLTDKKKCPVCDFESYSLHSVSAFSPYSALGACPTCDGFGAKLVYDEDLLIDKDLTIEEGGIKLLEFGSFHDYRDILFKRLKKQKVPFDVPIKKLPKSFIEMLYEGEGNYPGFKDFFKYLESKRYKPAMRVFIRNIQKEETCTSCHGSRLNPKISHYYYGHHRKSLPQLMQMSIKEMCEWLSEEGTPTTKHEHQLRLDLTDKLQLAIDLGLNHLHVLRKAKSLSAGEYQRLLLIKYLSFQGTDALFVLDEPSLGLGEREQEKIIHGFRRIIDQGNTVIVIDHSEQIKKASDFLVQMGPESGRRGGEVIYSGKPEASQLNSLKLKAVKKPKEIQSTQNFSLSGIEIYDRKFPDLEFPEKSLLWVTGASGVGKSTMFVKVLANAIHKKIHKETITNEKFKFEKLKYPNYLEDVIVVSSSLNRFTSRSSVGSITELSPAIRRHFLKLPVSKSMGLKDGHLSSNSELGACPRCEGKGFLVIEMQYLEDIILECEDCKGRRIKPQYAEIYDGKMMLHEAYNLPLHQVLEHIELTPKFQRIWDYLKILNLDYLALDRSVNSLSGGEKQRIYLLSKILKKIQNSLLILENLSFGLSSLEVQKIGELLDDMRLLGNTIVVIDSSPDFQKLCSHRLEIRQSSLTISKP